MAATLRRGVASRSISFSGAGFLGSYHLGVATSLQSLQVLPDLTTRKGNQTSAAATTLLGSSAGALVAAAVGVGGKRATIQTHAAESGRKPAQRGRALPRVGRR